MAEKKGTGTPVPTFTYDEALLLCAALNGVRCVPATLYANLYSAAEFVKAQEMWGVNPAVLLDRIERLSNDEKQAVIDAIVNDVWGKDLPYHTEDLKDRIYASGLVKGKEKEGRK